MTARHSPDDAAPFERPDWDGWHGPSGDPNDRQFGDVVTPLEGSSDDVDAVLVGEPYDGAVIGRRGARHAPVAIRHSLAGVKTARCVTDGSDADPAFRIGDRGDLELPDAGVASVQDHVHRAVADVHDREPLPVFLGGDNSLTYPNVAPLLERGRVGVVNLDAHLDCREVREDDGPTSGTPYRQLLNDGLETYVCVGARHFETSGPYVEYVDRQDGTIVPAEAFDGGTDAVVERVREAMADVDLLYVSVDCDVLDATAAPGVSAPTPGGLTTRELFAFVRAMAGDERLAGFEVVECSPPLDEQGRTVDAAARTIAHALTGYVTA
ncbi:formimidoylglutamase [Halopiger djelfimassiliensis]|uniref:formimidoylglutamase n=1 Tax=Halopiger djelfimassiliensis TaxID=1293047 RepID=UPI000677FC74|nr:formimidoylglutamase [Halopiger djelfimassiliensis]